MYGIAASSMILGIVIAATMGITLAAGDWTSIREVRQRAREEKRENASC